MPIQCEITPAGIAVVKLSNPQRRNALDREMFDALGRIWPELQLASQVRCVVIGGEHQQAFSAGADLGAHLDRCPDVDEMVDRALLKTFLFCKPLIAAIEGACVAGGLELALAADIRIAAKDAMLGLPEVRWGIVPSGGGAMKLCDQIGQARAMDLILSGRLISGEEAERIGLVSQSCEPGEAWTVALERAGTIATHSLSAMVAAKRSAQEHRIAIYAAQEPVERIRVALVRGSGDSDEGKAAFLNKRQPRFGSVPSELLHQSPPAAAAKSPNPNQDDPTPSKGIL